MSDYSLLTAYLCWLFGGLYGLHHFYLGRDKHALITFVTFGGYCTLGLIRDLWRLPEYVRAANNDLKYQEEFKEKLRKSQRPPTGPVRQVGLFTVANIFGYLVDWAIPVELLDPWLVKFLQLLLVPFASAVGVWLVGNVHPHRTDLLVPLIGSYLGALPAVIYKMSVVSYCPIIAVCAYNKYSKQWQSVKQPKKPLPKRLALATFCVVLYLSLWSSFLYFNCTIDEPDDLGRPIKFRDALSNFLKSDAYANLAQAIWMLYERIRYQGVVNLWREIVQEFDVSGKGKALAVLGLQEGATADEIMSRYKKLSRDFHPDKERDESKKAGKQEKFIEVQQALKTLEPFIHRYKSKPAPSNSRDEL